MFLLLRQYRSRNFKFQRFLFYIFKKNVALINIPICEVRSFIIAKAPPLTGKAIHSGVSLFNTGPNYATCGAPPVRGECLLPSLKKKIVSTVCATSCRPEVQEQFYL